MKISKLLTISFLCLLIFIPILVIPVSAYYRGDGFGYSDSFPLGINVTVGQYVNATLTEGWQGGMGVGICLIGSAQKDMPFNVTYDCGSGWTCNNYDNPASCQVLWSNPDSFVIMGRTLDWHGGEASIIPHLMWKIGEANYIYNVTYTIKNLAGIPLQNINVRTVSDLTDTQYTTDVNGNITQQITLTDNTVTVSTTPTGFYNAYSEIYELTSNMAKTIYLTQSTSQSQEINITYHVKNIYNLPIYNALVTHTISSQSTTWGNTDEYGNVTFNLVPVFNHAFYYDITKLGYEEYMRFFSFSGNPTEILINVTLLGGTIPTLTPTPTLTPITFDVWSLEAIPNSINLGSSSQLHLYNSNISKFVSDAGIVIYYENKNLGAYSSNNIIGVFLYNISTVNWDFKPNMNAPYDYSAHEPVLFTVIPTTTGTYTYSVGIAKRDSTSLGSATTNLLINEGGLIPTNLVMTLSAGDGSTTSHLMNYTLILTEIIGGISHTYNVNYDIEVNLQRGKVFTLTGQKIGYVDNTITFTVPLNQNIIYGDFGSYISVSLFPIGTISAGNTTLTIHVTDKETYYPIPNVQIVMSGFLTPKFTGTSGESVSFILPQNTGYTVTASKDGYCGVSETGNTSTRDYYYIDLYMKFGACLGVTPTHTPIPNATPISVIPTTVYNNFTGTVTICNNLPVNASAIDHIKNQLACFGITDLTGQNLALSVLIILGIGLIAALKAGAIGFAIGGVLGAVISMVMGLIPFWIIIVLVICSIAILAIKIFFTPG